MLFIGKAVQQLTEADLNSLVGVTRESEAIDFKERAYPPPPDDQLPTDQKEKDRIKNEWKISLCTDLTALANANGGWIICGMKEMGGVATEICGLGSGIDIEREIARLGQAANSGIEPPINSVEFSAIPLQESEQAVAIAIRISKSYGSPHRVKASRKFHIRRSGRNDEMNIDELRSAFNLSTSITERIKAFRDERIRIISDEDGHEEIPAVLDTGMRVAIHSIPLSFSDVGHSISLKTFEFARDAFPDFSMHSAFMSRPRFSIDGLTMSIDGFINSASEYIHLFRNGVAEYACTFALTDREQEKTFSPYEIEDRVLNYLPVLLNMQSNLRVEVPIVVMLSLVGVQGYRFAFARSTLLNRATLISRNVLRISDVVLENYGADLQTSLRDMFDMLWNAGGLIGSKSYNDTGAWIRKDNYQY